MLYRGLYGLIKKYSFSGQILLTHDPDHLLPGFFWLSLKPLKKLLAISFLFIYLFSTTELSQLLKMPVLVQHFIEHQEVNSNITFWQFLNMHYASGGVNDADHAKDMQLPFKAHDNCVASFSNVYLPTQKISIAKPVRILTNKHFKTQEQFLHSTFLSNIWQPPRIC